MGSGGTILGIVVVAVVLAGVALYTNIFQLARPAVEASIDYSKDLASKVQGKDVVSKAEQISSEIKKVTSEIKVQNPLAPAK